MKCEAILPLFSDILDARLSGSLEEAVRAHFEQCAACRQEYASFAAATARLRALEVGPTPREHVASIMAAVGETAGEQRWAGAARVRRAGTHVLAAALGAAAAVLVMANLPETQGETAVAPPPAVRFVPQPVGLQLVAGEGTLLRDGRARPLDPANVFEPRAGDVLSVRQGGGVSLVLGDAGALRIEARPEAPPPPEVVEKVVERVRTVRRGPLLDLSLEVDSEAVRQAAREVSRSIDLFGSSLAGALRERAEAVAAAPAAAEEPAPAPVLPGALPEAAAPVSVAAASPAPEADVPSAVVVTRAEGRVSLETFGPRYEIVPRLLVLLEDRDPQVVQLALSRLEEMRRELESDAALADRLVAVDRDGEKQGGALDRVERFFTARATRDEKPRVEDGASYWNSWWEKNALLILESETWGTL
ncbi:MAG: zf-HC2 domain-containing protein [Planctomycetes bacterium]|nr:zf-HC2 domain-containing protein [Planctomycetota bacterium]